MNKGPHVVCHGYNPATGEYTGPSLAFYSPNEDTYPLPANAVWEAPPYTLPAGAAWAMGATTWEAVEDHRGTAYSLDGKLYVMDALGPLPAGATTTEPAVTTPTQPTSEERTRTHRDALLAASDVWVLRLYERGEPVPEALVKYRQDLRDITSDPRWPDVPFPTAPDLDL